MSRHVLIQSLLLMASLAGCTGYIEAAGGLSDLPPDEAAAQGQWQARVLPILRMGTTPECVGCHDGSVVQAPLMAGPAYLAGGDDLAIRTTLMTFVPAIITLDSPETSLLVTKQAHEGPPMNTFQTSDILDWIMAEKVAKDTP